MILLGVFLSLGFSLSLVSKCARSTIISTPNVFMWSLLLFSVPSRLCLRRTRRED